MIISSRINTGTQHIELRLRVQVGAGPIVGSHVGVRGGEGRGGTWAYILSGREVDRTIFADHYNSPGTSHTELSNTMPPQPTDQATY